MLLATGGCAPARVPHLEPGPPLANAEDRAFARFVERYLDQTLGLDPVRATEVGVVAHDGAWPDWSDEGRTHAAATLDRLARDFARLDSTQMSGPAALDAVLVTRDLERWREAVETSAHPAVVWYDTVATGLSLLTRPPPDPDRADDRRAALLARIERLPRFLEAAETALQPPSPSAAAFVSARIGALMESIEVGLDPVFAVDPALRPRFSAAASPALEALARFEDRLDPAATATVTNPGARDRLGPEAYAARLRRLAGPELTPARLAVRAESWPEQTRDAMRALGAATATTTKDPDDAVRALLDRATRPTATDAEPLAVVEGLVASRARGLGAPLFEGVHGRYLVRPAPPRLAGASALVAELPGPLGPELGARLYVGRAPDTGLDDPRRSGHPRALAARFVHVEAQRVFLQVGLRGSTASLARRALWNPAMQAGFPLFAADVAMEADRIPDPLERLLLLAARRRACVLAWVDVRLHALDLPPEGIEPWAMTLLVQEGLLTPEEAARALLRARLHPGRLADALIGYTALSGMYQAALRKGADPGSIRRQLLDNAALPPDTSKEWLSAQEDLLP